MIDAFNLVHSVSRIKIGNIFSINFDENNELIKFLQYQIDNETVLKLEKFENSWVAREEIIEYEIETVNVQGEISSSLFETGVDLGLDFVTILKMSDILSGEIDFSSDIQKGDSFKILYEKRFLYGEFIMDGKVLAVEFFNQGKVFKSYRFNNGEKDDYYNEKGDSMRKAFLRSPLNFRYISSGYSNGRYHPILKKVMPHKAIDYAAAYGTPVISVGDGKIIFASYKRGYGNYVIISHANSYVTQYAHLSGFAKGIKYGVRVEQGQTIAFVGSTGFSTGAHLDYSMKKNGVFVNPMTVNIPSGVAVPEELMKTYLAHIKALEKELNK
ncbi:MAG: peptidoglycan DD-metalloendopeptidase family protein [Candidatus Pacebacteria bacterium]|nr:peptidoglycan DD-metalloendopeptidase family protein [Candidatus Paceibacterota bacterium]